MTEAVNRTKTENPKWAALVADEQWEVYSEAIRITRKTGARFVLGGAFGLAAYTHRFRNTKDLDFFVLPSDKDRIVDALTKAGFDDYYSMHEYDRGWIYRAVKNGVIVDTIWQTPNRRSQVDEEWFKRGRIIQLRGQELMALPAEELLAIKLYVMQRDRCDWPDLINLLYATSDQLDWDHVLFRMQKDEPLLCGLLNVFNWVAPERAARIPERIRKQFNLCAPDSEDLALSENHRVAMLDSRPWFAAFQPEDEPMKV